MFIPRVIKLFLDFFIYPLARHARKVIYYALVRPSGIEQLIFENRKLEIKENYNSYNEIDDRKIV